MKCLLVSFFNSHNIGDVVIAETLFKRISSICQVEKYSYVGDPLVFTDPDNVVEPNNIDQHQYKRKVYNFLSKYRLYFVVSAYRVLRSKANSFSVFENKIKESDFLVIGGGNMIFDTDAHLNSALHFNKYIMLAKKYKKKVFVIDIGIGPFKTQHQVNSAIAALQSCNYITFRDHKSYEIYSKHASSLGNAFLSVDPVFLFPFQLPNKEKLGVCIGLNVFNNKLIGESSLNYSKSIMDYAQLAQMIQRTFDAKVILFSTDLTDYEAIYEVHRYVEDNPNIMVEEICGLSSLLHLYGQLTILIGSRMHSMIIAYTQHIPVIGLSWQPKIDAMFEIIDEKKCVFPYNDIRNSLDNILACSADKLLALQDEKDKIANKLTVLREKAEIDINILKRLLHGMES